ncbi:MAG: hypothetical protein IPL61_08530 [Myxococcales bacterium]|nr:hypothetical protein [Myxococcales bacterium]
MRPDDPTDLDPDDDLTVPAPDADADAGERARARAFAELIDKVVAGRTPAAVPAEDQALVEVATALRATMRPVELGASRRASIVEAALATAIDRRGGRVGASTSGALPVVPITAAPRRRAARAVPWVVAAATSLVAAATLTLWLRDRGDHRGAPTATAAPLPLEQRSRSADALVGVIERDRAGAAVDRIDAIYADRLGGFRERTMAGGPR